MAILSDARHAGRDRRKPPRLWRSVRHSAELVCALARARDRSGIFRRRARIDRAVALDAGRDRARRLALREPWTRDHCRRALVPAHLLLRKRPQDIGLYPDGDPAPTGATAVKASNIVDASWAATQWTLARAARTARFWWIALGYFSILYAWYAVQVHQTKYLVEIGFAQMHAAWALGFVSLVGVPGQIIFGAASDRIGREWTWAIGCCGFVICFVMLIFLQAGANPLLLYAMILAQGFLGYSATAVLGPIVAEIFEGPHFGAIFGTLMVAAICGGAAGPWITGLLYDATGNYIVAFWIALALSIVSAMAIFLAAPRKVRLVAGQVGKGNPSP